MYPIDLKGQNSETDKYSATQREKDGIIEVLQYLQGCISLYTSDEKMQKQVLILFYLQKLKLTRIHVNIWFTYTHVLFLNTFLNPILNF